MRAVEEPDQPTGGGGKLLAVGGDDRQEPLAVLRSDGVAAFKYLAADLMDVTLVSILWTFSPRNGSRLRRSASARTVWSLSR
ncbi:MAG: hypothetical protein H0T56_00480 [Pseudaminobacter sp.]|nr:hypothetical protein [Pseudaminobacter sp.]